MSQKEIQNENWKEEFFLSFLRFFSFIYFLFLSSFFQLITLNIVPTYILLLENIICTICSYIKKLGYMII